MLLKEIEYLNKWKSLVYELEDNIVLRLNIIICQYPSN